MQLASRISIPVSFGVFRDNVTRRRLTQTLSPDKYTVRLRHWSTHLDRRRQSGRALPQDIGKGSPTCFHPVKYSAIFHSRQIDTMPLVNVPVPSIVRAAHQLEYCPSSLAVTRASSLRTPSMNQTGCSNGQLSSGSMGSQ